MTERNIFLVRHAEAVHQREIKCYLGQSNPGLSSLGLQQAKQLGVVFVIKMSGRFTAAIC
ncbi:MAG: histidine phosphatase family protein [Dehalobacter sp.]|nr:histidine phosphatase family protein [Dehalobacter sp.]MCG1025181.1 histidine phosphatase family protein [Dehalobacter sp.]MDJ0304899.1 histidine phosphatase family protein [Dehalobacter sp.]